MQSSGVWIAEERTMEQLDVGAWVGIVTLLLAIPVGIMSHVLGHRFLQHLEKRRLVKSGQTRQQAIRSYNMIKAFHTRARDRYAYYFLLVGCSVLCAIGSATLTIVLVLSNPDFSTDVRPQQMILLLLTVLFFVLAVLLMASFYGTSRQRDRFDAYKAEFEAQWGPIDPPP
jgi:hypothetical protein